MLILQMTGLPGAGKSTLAERLKTDLATKNIKAEIIDGDVYRKTINKDLGFSAADRKENIRRLGQIANEYKKTGVVAIIAAISPYEEIRNELKEKFDAKIIWVSCPVEILIKRDSKDLYRRALLNENDPQKISNLTGINDPFETPANADLTIDTGNSSVEECAKMLFNYVTTLLNS